MEIRVVQSWARWLTASAAPAGCSAAPDSVELLGAPDLRRPELGKLWANLQSDLQQAQQFLAEIESPVTVFGSARSPEGSEDFHLAEEVGKKAAEAGMDAMTGGHGGVMLGASVGHRLTADCLHATGSQNSPRTLAVCLGDLPREQKLNSSVGKAVRLREFLFRKTALYGKSRGVLALPGGYGTMDEFFEVWAQRSRDQHRGKLGVFCTPFWKPILNALWSAARRDRDLIGTQAWDRLAYQDDPEAFLHGLPSQEQALAHREPEQRVVDRMSEDITRTLQALDRLPEAVTVLGGHRLRGDDRALESTRRLCRMLTAEGVPLRVGNPPAVARAVLAGASDHDPRVEVQGFLLEGDRHLDAPGLRVHATQRDFVLHKELLTRSSKGLVFLPGGLGTLANLFGVLTQIQTGKRPPVPIVLLDRAFWTPIMEAINSTLLNDGRNYISPEDLKLVTVITDDPAVAARALRGEPMNLPGAGEELRP
ncbi:MAG: LOG family protein [Candidatus Eremiobacterota bacterium]